jgi:hypothetical protein
MIEKEQLTPLNNPDEQQGLISGNAQESEGNGEAKPWIIPIGSRAHLDGDTVATPQPALPPCSPSDAEKILRKNINNIITTFINRHAHGNKQAHQKMLYRRMRLICAKPVADMNQKELEKIWLWLRKEYGNEGVKN